MSIFYANYAMTWKTDKSMNADGTHGSLILNTLDQRDLGNDVMARRLKNRERQRRYRARKRLEADRKSYVPSHSMTPQVDAQLNGTGSNCVARVHCKRDWKKDARAVTSMRQEDAVNGFLITSEGQRILPSEKMAEVQAPVEWESRHCLSMVYRATNKTNRGRRNWKADARKK